MKDIKVIRVIRVRHVFYENMLGMSIYVYIYVLYICLYVCWGAEAWPLTKLHAYGEQRALSNIFMIGTAMRLEAMWSKPSPTWE